MPASSCPSRTPNFFAVFPPLCPWNCHRSARSLTSLRAVARTTCTLEDGDDCNRTTECAGVGHFPRTFPPGENANNVSSMEVGMMKQYFSSRRWIDEIVHCY